MNLGCLITKIMNHCRFLKTKTRELENPNFTSAIHPKNSKRESSIMPLNSNKTQTKVSLKRCKKLIN